MIISVEGIDGAGKSTLCRKLSDKLGFPILDLNKDMLEPYTYTHEQCKILPSFDRDSWKVAAVALETLYLASANAILDRTTLSCWAYQQRNAPNIAYLEQVIKHVKPVIVMLDTDVNTCLERDPDVAKVGWGYDDLVFQKHRMLASAECFANCGVPVIIIHNSKTTATNICDSILKELKSMGLL